MNRFRKLLFSLCLTALTAGCATWFVPQHDAETLLAKGETAFRAGRYARALKFVQTGLNASSDQRGTVASAPLYELNARIKESQGNYPEAIASAKKCLDLISTTREQVIEVECLLDLASNYRRLQNYNQSEAFIAQSSSLVDFSAKSSQLSRYLLVSGALKQDQDKIVEAQADYKAGLNAAKTAADKYLQARALNNIGGTYRLMAKYSEASRYYAEALQLRQQLGDRGGQASTLGNQCVLEALLGELPAAVTLCNQSLRMAKRIGARTSQANALSSLGAIYQRLGKPDRAQDYYQKSADLKRILKDKAGLGRTLNNIGEVHLSQNRFDKANDYFKQSLEIKESIDDVPGQGATWGNVGLSFELSGNYQAAMESYTRSVIAHTSTVDQEGLWRNFANISRVQDLLSNRQAAIYFAKRSVSIIQSIRTDLADLKEKQRKSFIRNKRNVYELLADMLIEEGRLYEARQVMTMLKEDEYNEFIQRSDGVDTVLAEPVFNAEEHEQILRYAEISRKVVTKYLQYQDLKTKKLTGLNQDELNQFSQLKIELSQIETEFELFLLALSDQFNEQENVIAEKDLEKLQSLQATLGQLNPKAVFLHYLVTENNLKILVSFGDRFLKPVYHKSDVTRSDLNRLIYDFTTALQDPSIDPKQTAQALYEKVISPVRPDLNRLELELLVIHLDEALRYVPISALHDGEKYMAELFETVIYNVQAESKLAFPPKRDWRVAGLGVSKEVREGFDPLPGVERELDAIVKEEQLEDDPGILPGQIYINEEFTSERLQAVLADKENPFQVVHIASHYQFHAGGDRDSFLLTGTGDDLALSTLSSGDFNMGAVDLFVLSACDTALDTDDKNGVEIEGLANSLQENGAKSVMATLWKVEDQSTASFMQNFYQVHEAEDITKARALQSVQINFINGTIGPDIGAAEDRGSFSVDGEQINPSTKDYTHPYYWAPFILMGNFL